MFMAEKSNNWKKKSREKIPSTNTTNSQGEKRSNDEWKLWEFNKFSPEIQWVINLTS